MAEYHKFVFDTKNRKFVGEFEKMYNAESEKNFDSWHQEDSRQTHREIISNLLKHWQFDFIIDLGCGKGTFTHLLKKRNNDVLALDISQKAISIARSRYPDIDFQTLDLQNLNETRSLLDNLGKKISLFVSLECFSYLLNWKDILHYIAKKKSYVIISVYIPEHPIGFVKSDQQLISEFLISFEPIEIISLKTSNFIILFGKSKMV